MAPHMHICVRCRQVSQCWIVQCCITYFFNGLPTPSFLMYLPRSSTRNCRGAIQRLRPPPLGWPYCRPSLHDGPDDDCKSLTRNGGFRWGAPAVRTTRKGGFRVGRTAVPTAGAPYPKGGFRVGRTAGGFRVGRTAGEPHSKGGFE